MKLDFLSLRPKLDLEDKYVDFSILRTSLSVLTVIQDLATTPTGRLTKNGEYRATCPKCEKEKSFALNVNTNRFNCFNKGCFLKGGGVIDLVAKLCEVPAKEASHLLACAYGISPYTGKAFEVSASAGKPIVTKTPVVSSKPPKRASETVTREEFDELQNRVERLSQIFWAQMFGSNAIDENDPELFNGEENFQSEKVLSSA